MSKLQTLANAFYAAADAHRNPMSGILDQNGHEVPMPAEVLASSRICADVLKAIGDVYQGQAVN